MSSKGEAYVGTSGYQYDHWQGMLYPDDAPRDDWFGIYADTFDTVEINNTFYNLPDAGTFDQWRERAPNGFIYALKFSRFGTHMKKLSDPEQPIEAFVENARRLGDHLGPILVQLPPNWNVNADRLHAFLEVTPDDLRWAVELRDESWLCDEVYAVLREHNAALCLHDMIDDHPRQVTASWVYRRYHGMRGGDKYAGTYPHQQLSADAQRLREHIDDGQDVYVYFNNDEKGHAPRDAQDLRRYLTGN